MPSATTYYNINGVTYIGAAGSRAVVRSEGRDRVAADWGDSARAPLAIPSVAWRNVTPTFTATEVYAGSSLESTIQDHVAGHSGRPERRYNHTECRLTRGPHRRLGFPQSIPVTLAPTTIVSVDGVASPSPAPTIDTISIGQYIEVSGQVNPADASNGFLNPDGSFNPTGLDATNGQVRIKPTTLWGTLNSATPGSASVSLKWIQHYEPNDFYFPGAGTNASMPQRRTTPSIPAPRI